MRGEPSSGKHSQRAPRGRRERAGSGFQTGALHALPPAAFGLRTAFKKAELVLPVSRGSGARAGRSWTAQGFLSSR